MARLSHLSAVVTVALSAAAVPSMARDAGTPMVVMVDTSGGILVDSQVMNRADLKSYLSGIEPADRTITRVFVRAHPALARAKLISVMDAIAAEGFTNIVFVPGGNSDSLERGFGSGAE